MTAALVSVLCVGGALLAPWIAPSDCRSKCLAVSQELDA